MSRFPHQAPLPVPQLWQVTPFEEQLESVKQRLLELLQNTDPDVVEGVKAALEEDGEILSKILQVLVLVLQHRERQWQQQALQMFGMYATDDDAVDVIVSQLGLERQIIDPGDPNAFPPKPPIKESNEALLTRYYLAPFALASTGTAQGYRYHALTMGERPEMTVDAKQPNKVVVTYDFSGDPHPLSGQVKDVRAYQTTPGEVSVAILAHPSDSNPQGVANNKLLNTVSDYLHRDDIAQATDKVTVQTVELLPWQCHAILYLSRSPDAELIKNTTEKAVKTFAEQEHQLGGRIELSKLHHALIQSSNAHRIELLQPTEAIRAEQWQAPLLENVSLEVRHE